MFIVEHEGPYTVLSVIDKDGTIRSGISRQKSYLRDDFQSELNDLLSFVHFINYHLVRWEYEGMDAFDILASLMPDMADFINEFATYLNWQNLIRKAAETDVDRTS